MASTSRFTVLNPFTLDAAAHSDAHGLGGFEETLTVQADAAQADINNIVKQFGLTKMLPYGDAVPVYDDYSEFPNDFHAAQNFILDSQAAFMHLPAEQRARFDNDPGRFLDFVYDDSNRDEAIAMGFIPPVSASQALANEASSAGGLPPADAPDKP